MRRTLQLLKARQLLLVIVVFAMACGGPQPDPVRETATDPVAANIKMYSRVWDEIVNKRKLDLFNDSNFTKNVVMHVYPKDITGIDSARAYSAVAGPVPGSWLGNDFHWPFHSIR